MSKLIEPLELDIVTPSFKLNGTIFSKATLGLGNVENTALSTWVGSSNITTVGTLANLTVTNPITGSITGNAGSVTNGIYSTGNYTNPSWLTNISWSKIVSTPTTLSGYGITDGVTSVNGQTGTVNLTTTNITDSLNKRFVTDPQKTVLGNTSGTNSGDISLTQNGFSFVSLSGQVLSLSAIPQSEVTGLVTALSGKEPTITVGTTGQYWRGDKTFQTLNKTAVGLANVDNTSDVNKPISTATQTALDAKQPLDGDLTALAALTTLGVANRTSTDTWSTLTVGTAANNLVQLTAAAKLPAVDGSLLTNVNAAIGEQSFIDFSNDIANPAAPATTETRVFSYQAVSRKPVLAIRTSDEIRTIQSAIWRNNAISWKPSGVAAGVWSSGTSTNGGTYSNVAISALSTKFLSFARSRYASPASTPNQSLRQGQTSNRFTRGSSSAFGGYFFHAIFGFGNWTNGGRLLVGMTGGNVATNPSLQDDTLAFCIDDTDNAAISFMSRATGTLTKNATGFSAEVDNGFEAFIYCAAGSSQVSWRLININSGAEASGTVATNLPTATAFVAPVVSAGNAALTAAGAIAIDVVSIYVEANY
jgi:hypothetical protein